MSAPPRVAGQDRWWRELRRWPGVAALRADARRNLLAAARVACWGADWEGSRTRPGRDATAAAIGACERTVARHWRRLEAWGFLMLTEPGTTPAFRPALLAAGGGNLRREWVLVLPPELGAPPAPGSVTPPLRSRNEGSPSRARTREGNPEPNEDAAARRLPPVPPPAFPRHSVPVSRAEGLSAAAAMRDRSAWLRPMSDAALRSALRPWWRAGWTLADVWHALDVMPDGTRHRFTERPRRPYWWVRHRMAFWADPAGCPLPPPHAAVAAERERVRAIQRDEHEARQRGLAGRAADAAWHAEQARAMLAAVLGRPVRRGCG